MTNLINKLVRDEAGFIVSAELVLISTIAVLGLVVGLSEVSINVNNELEDVGSAFSAMSQSFSAQGAWGHKGNKGCSSFQDGCDFCSGQNDVH
jgi:Flp pilus assembly pilin Flp